MTDELHPLMRRFAEEYLIDFNPSKAALRAGYLNGSTGRDLLKDPRVDALIQEGKRKASDRANVSVDWVIEKLRRIADATPFDFMDAQAKVDFSQLTEEQKDALKTLKWSKFGPEIQMHDKVGALNAIGKYFGMFTDKVEHSGPGGLPLAVAPTMTPKEAMEAYAASINEN